jgi:hypothetical protein
VAVLLGPNDVLFDVRIDFMSGRLAKSKCERKKEELWNSATNQKGEWWASEVMILK